MTDPEKREEGYYYCKDTESLDKLFKAGAELIGKERRLELHHEEGLFKIVIPGSAKEDGGDDEVVIETNVIDKCPPRCPNGD